MKKDRVIDFLVMACLLIALFTIIISVQSVRAAEQDSCASNWNCTDWKPTFCPRNETQVRHCKDLNKCNVEIDKPSEVQECTFSIQYNKNALTAILILAVITIAIVLVELIRRIRDEKNRKSSLPETKYTYSP